MKNFLLVGFICFLQLHADESVRLQYQPNIPIELTSQLELQMDEVLPGFKLAGTSLQTTQADVSLVGESTDIPFLNLPFDLQFTLKSIQVDLLANNVKAGFSTSQPSNSMQLAQAQRLVNFPIKLHFDEKGMLAENNLELQKAFAEFPVLGQIHLDKFLQEWFEPLTTLAGFELVVGSKFQRERMNGSFVTYEIITIDEEGVEAKFNGPIARNQIPLGNRPKTYLDLNGVFEGHVIWNRENALLCNVQAVYEYQAILKEEDSSWTMKFVIKHNLYPRSIDSKQVSMSQQPILSWRGRH